MAKKLSLHVNFDFTERKRQKCKEMWKILRTYNGLFLKQDAMLVCDKVWDEELWRYLRLIEYIGMNKSQPQSQFFLNKITGINPLEKVNIELFFIDNSYYYLHNHELLALNEKLQRQLTFPIVFPKWDKVIYYLRNGINQFDKSLIKVDEKLLRLLEQSLVIEKLSDKSYKVNQNREIPLYYQIDLLYDPNNNHIFSKYGDYLFSDHEIIMIETKKSNDNDKSFTLPQRDILKNKNTEKVNHNLESLYGF